MYKRTEQWYVAKESKVAMQRTEMKDLDLQGCTFAPDMAQSSRTLGMVYSPTGAELAVVATTPAASVKAADLHGGVSEYVERQERARALSDLRKVTPHADGTKWTGKPTVQAEFLFSRRGKVPVRALGEPTIQVRGVDRGRKRKRTVLSAQVPSRSAVSHGTVVVLCRLQLAITA